MLSSRWAIRFLALGLFATLFAGCGGQKELGLGSSPTTTIVTLSDPATCSAATSGPFKSIFVTVTGVMIHTSGTASENDAGWVDLIPALKTAPVQVDLLGPAASNGCFLATLGSTTQLQPGTYQQIRLILADNNTPPTGTNNCKTAGSNCVVLTSDQPNPRRLELSSETRTGLRIPPGQIAGGKFTVVAGQTKDLDIHFDGCGSVVSQPNGQFRLKPAITAGEVGTTASASISGTIIDNVTKQAVAGGKTIVALEQRDSAGIARVIMQTTPDASGNFVFCPVPPGSYEVVATAVNGSGVSYAATVVTGITPGNTIASLPLNPVTGASTAPASLVGQITASGGASSVDLTVSALQPVTSGSATFNVTVPLALLSAATATLTTQTGGTCPAGTSCTGYTLAVPAANATVGAFSATGTTFTAGASTAANYVVEAQAFGVVSATTPVSGQPTCTQSRLSSQPIQATAGANATVPTLSFVGCL